MPDFLLKNARYLGKSVSLLVRDGKIAALESTENCNENFPKKPQNDHGDQNDHAETTEVYDAHGQILFPSFIDAHVHLREPGFEWKEDIASGLNAAAHGGFGTVMCMANTDPVNDTAAVTEQILSIANRAFPHGPRVCPIGAATLGLKGESLAPMYALKKAGCIAISNDGKPIADSGLFRRVMEYAADLNLIVIDHCEDPFLAKGSHMNEGETSGKLGLRGQPDIAESLQAIRSMLLAEYLHLPIHIAHVSAARTVDLIAWSKARGTDVSAETCPHYLLLDDTSVNGYNTNAKVNPPLRTQKDIAALRQAVKNGTIDMLVTDHAPHATHEKEVPFDQAPNGFTGLDLAVSLTYGLVRENILDEADLIRLWCLAPAKRFHLPINTFHEGDPADFFLFDPNHQWQVDGESLYSKSHNTPWLGKTLTGRLTAHWLGGIQIV